MSFAERFKMLAGSSVRSIASDEQSSSGSIVITFDEGTKIFISYWRLLEAGRRISNFDHGQRYGLPNAVNAVKEIENTLLGKVVKTATVHSSSGDLELSFGDCSISIFRFTSNEVWEVEISDGVGQYSNYV